MHSIPTRAVVAVGGVVASLLTFGVGAVMLDGPPEGDVLDASFGASSRGAPTSTPADPLTPDPDSETTTTTENLNGASSKEPRDRQAPSAVRLLDVGCDRPVEITAPASDLASVVAGADAGTCFLLQPGEYRFSNVVPKDWMTFIGTSRSEVRVVGDSSTENAFHGTAVGVNIGRMTFTGFQGNGGAKAQEQAPIRGTSAVWLSERGRQASDWLIEDIESSNNLASGIFVGDHFTVRLSLFAHNGVTGIGGSEIVGGLIEGNVVRNNGAGGASGELANNGGMKFTQAIAGDEPLTVRRNEVHHNDGVGIWCDIACDGFRVEGNYIHDQESHAVVYELSQNAEIVDNLIVGSNRWTDFRRDFNAGAITLGESNHVLVEGNHIEGAAAGVVVRQTRRPVLPQESFLHNYENVSFVAGQVTVRANTIIGARAMGISTGVTGSGLISDPGSIVFEANAYDNAGSLTFWWNNGDSMDFARWQAAGRDSDSPQAGTTRPDWEPLTS